jgi:hypothetical protein
MLESTAAVLSPPKLQKPAALCPWTIGCDEARVSQLQFWCPMLRRRLFTWITLYCFAVATALPGFAAVLPDEAGSLSIVICSADGFKTLEIAATDDTHGPENHPRCDPCQIHCGIGTASQTGDWTVSQAGRHKERSRPLRQTIHRIATPGPRLPRGPPSLPGHSFRQA